MGKLTDNYKKHTTKNRIQKWLIENFYQTMFSMAGNVKPQKILDVGCGEGFTLSRFKEKNIGKELEGIDYLETAIELGRKNHPDLKLKQGNIYKLPYKDNSFDLVICTEVLEHVERPQEALKELVRISGKYIMLSVPNEPLFMGANFLRGKNWSRWGNDIEHINHWTSRRFENFVKKEKVNVVQKSHPFPWTMILLKKV